MLGNTRSNDWRCNVAGGERTLQGARGIAADGRRPLAARAPRGRARPRISALVARADPFFAKRLLAAGKELQIVAHAVAIMGDKARQPAVMVGSARGLGMSPLSRSGSMLEQTEIPQQHLGGVAEVEEVLPSFTRVARFEMQ